MEENQVLEKQNIISRIDDGYLLRLIGLSFILAHFLLTLGVLNDSFGKYLLSFDSRLIDLPFFKYIAFEILFSLLPVLMATTLLCFVQQKKWRIVLGIFFGIIILSLQLKKNILFNGGDFTSLFQCSVDWILTFFYGVVSFSAYKILLNGPDLKDKIKASLLAHIPAVAAVITAVMFEKVLGFALIVSTLAIDGEMAFLGFILPAIDLIILIYAIVGWIVHITRVIRKRKANRTIPL